MNKKAVDVRTLLLVYVGMLPAPIGSAAFITLIPSFEHYFNSQIEILALAVTVYMIFFGIFQLFSGMLSDIFGRKYFVVAGLLSYSVGSLLIILAPTVIFLIIGRAVQGIGDGLMNPIYLALIGDVATEQNRGKLISIYSTLVISGNTAGSFFGGFLGEVNWKFLYLFVGLLAFTMFFAYILLLRQNTTKRISNTVREHLIIMKGILGHKGVITLIIGAFLLTTVRSSLLTFLSDTLGRAPVLFSNYEIGLVFTFLGLVTIFAGPVMGLLIKRTSEKTTLIIGGFSMILGLSIILTSTWVSYIFITAAFYGIGYMFFYSVLNSLAIEMVPEYKGSVSSLFNAFFFFGFAFGPIALLNVYLLLTLQGVVAVGIIIAFVDLLAVLTAIKMRRKSKF